jgi:hypothetical protein
MKKIMFIALLFVTLPAYPWGLDKDYESCVLNHIEDAKSDTAASLVRQACREKFSTREEKCMRKARAGRDADTDTEYASAVLDCYEMDKYKCHNASFWSKHFGDCKK